MKKARAAAGPGTSTTSLADRTRLVISHCPGCNDPLDSPAYMIGKLVSPDLTRAVMYQLCATCGRQLEKANRKRSRALSLRIEENLERMGAFIGIERTGVQA